MPKRFVSDDFGNGSGVDTGEDDWVGDKLCEIPGTEKYWKAEAVFLAMGFTGVEKGRLLNDLNVKITEQNTIAVNENKQTSVKKVFAAGDCERGQSLIVWAIADG